MLWNNIAFSRHVFFSTLRISQQDYEVCKTKTLLNKQTKTHSCIFILESKWYYWVSSWIFRVHHMVDLQWPLAKWLRKLSTDMRTVQCLHLLASPSALLGHRSPLATQPSLSFPEMRQHPTQGSFPSVSLCHELWAPANTTLQKCNSLQFHKPMKFLILNIPQLLTMNLPFNMISHNSHEKYLYK